MIDLSADNKCRALTRLRRITIWVMTALRRSIKMEETIVKNEQRSIISNINKKKKKAWCFEVGDD